MTTLPNAPKRWSVGLSSSVMLLGVVLLSTVYPRLMLLGEFPATDEGFYAYQAQLVHHGVATGQGLPDIGPLALYPMLLAWIFELGPNPMLLLRIADLCIAAITTALLYRVLTRESGSRIGAALLALIFAAAMNHSDFVQFGFKNSIAAAWIPLLLATGIAQRARPDARLAWFVAGALTALSVLLRETFVPFAALGVLALLSGGNFRAAFRFASGGLITGGLLIGAILLSRGGVTQMIESYRDAGIVYASLESQRIDFLLNGTRAFAKAAIVPLCLAVLAVLALLVAGIFRPDRRVLGRALFWILAAAIALIEPVSKIGFPYHFAVSLVGLSGLCALAWRESSAASPVAKWAAVAICIASLTLFANRYQSLARHWPSTQETLAAAPSGQWPRDAIDRSNYLLAAEKIRHAIPADGSLSISGFMFALYPLTGHLPGSPELQNLSATTIKLGLSTERIEEALARCPPDVIMTTTRTDWPGSDILLAAVKGTGLYEQVDEVPVSDDRSYGHFAGVIFRRTSAHPCLRPQDGPTPL